MDQTNKPICLIIPPSVFLLDERVFMSLGILKVAAALERAGQKVEVLDLSGYSNYQEIASTHARQSEAEIFALTATTPQMPAAGLVAETIREERPKSRLVLGGPHITLVNASAKKEKKIGLKGRATSALEALGNTFDVVVAGDGEDAVFGALEKNPPNLIDGDDPKGRLFLTNKRLEELPWPARHLLDASSYHYDIEGKSATSLIAQLGCPFGCAFCGGRESPMLRKIRTRSTENIVAEVEHLHRTYGYEAFMFYDDELNVNPNMIELMDSIADLQERLGVEFRLRGFLKAQLFTEKQAEAMYRAGFRWLLVGFESGSDRILTNINKKATRDENTRCVEIGHRHGLKVKALMSIGHAGESEETVQDTRDWLLEVQPEDFDCTVITTYPGSPYYDHAIKGKWPGVWTYTSPKTGDKLHSYEVDFSHDAAYYKGRPGSYVSYVFTDFLKSEQLARLRDKMENEVREKLKIPFNPSASSRQFEHSMGQNLPGDILRRSE